MKAEAQQAAAAALAQPLNAYHAFYLDGKQFIGGASPRSPTSASRRRSSSCTRSTTSSRPGRPRTWRQWSRRSERPTRSPPPTCGATSSTCAHRPRDPPAGTASPRVGRRATAGGRSEREQASNSGPPGMTPHQQPHLLPTTVVGSHPQPEWLIDRRRLGGGHRLRRGPPPRGTGTACRPCFLISAAGARARVRARERRLPLRSLRRRGRSRPPCPSRRVRGRSRSRGRSRRARTR